MALTKDIPYYVKFTFAGEKCYCLVSKEQLNYVVHTKTKEPVGHLRVGDKITIIEDEHTESNYEIESISIEQLTDNLDLHKYGLDPHCEPAVMDKEWLFKILVGIKSV